MNLKFDGSSGLPFLYIRIVMANRPVYFLFSSTVLTVDVAMFLQMDISSELVSIFGQVDREKQLNDIYL